MSGIKKNISGIEGICMELNKYACGLNKPVWK